MHFENVKTTYNPFKIAFFIESAHYWDAKAYQHKQDCTKSYAVIYGWKHSVWALRQTQARSGVPAAFSYIPSPTPACLSACDSTCLNAQHPLATLNERTHIGSLGLKLASREPAQHQRTHLPYLPSICTNPHKWMQTSDSDLCLIFTCTRKACRLAINQTDTNKTHSNEKDKRIEGGAIGLWWGCKPWKLNNQLDFLLILPRPFKHTHICQ